MLRLAETGRVDRLGFQARSLPPIAVHADANRFGSPADSQGTGASLRSSTARVPDQKHEHAAVRDARPDACATSGAATGSAKRGGIEARAPSPTQRLSWHLLSRSESHHADLGGPRGRRDAPVPSKPLARGDLSSAGRGTLPATAQSPGGSSGVSLAVRASMVAQSSGGARPQIRAAAACSRVARWCRCGFGAGVAVAARVACARRPVEGQVPSAPGETAGAETRRG